MEKHVRVLANERLELQNSHKMRHAGDSRARNRCAKRWQSADGDCDGNAVRIDRAPAVACAAISAQQSATQLASAPSGSAELLESEKCALLRIALVVLNHKTLVELLARRLASFRLCRARHCVARVLLRCRSHLGEALHVAVAGRVVEHQVQACEMVRCVCAIEERAQRGGQCSVGHTLVPVDASERMAASRSSTPSRAEVRAGSASTRTPASCSYMSRRRPSTVVYLPPRVPKRIHTRYKLQTKHCNKFVNHLLILFT